MFRFLPTAALAICLAVPAAADTLKIEFFGLVSSANDGANDNIPLSRDTDLINDGVIELDDSVKGSLSIDQVTMLVTGFTLSIDAYTWTSTGTDSLSVSDNVMPGSSAPVIDGALVTARSITGPTSVLGFPGITPTGFQFGFASNDASILSGTGAPDEGQWLDMMRTDIADWTWLSFNDGTDIRYDVTGMSFERISMGEVPLPASLLFLLGGIGALAGFGRRKAAA